MLVQIRGHIICLPLIDTATLIFASSSEFYEIYYFTLESKFARGPKSMDNAKIENLDNWPQKHLPDI